ncbi:MAG: hypothetical protein OXG43_09645 [Chloroflexi bacterium]|nr:hypothetical protein [Chloroflexota bacterium]
MIPGLGRLLPQAARRMVWRGGPVTAATKVTNAVGHSAATASAARPNASVARQVPYGERPARNRQMTLLAELLGTDWRQELPVRFGVAVSDITRRQAAAAIRQLTGGVRPAHLARGTWHRVAVDPDWIDRPSGACRQLSRPTAQLAAPATAPATADVLPIQVRALRLLGERLGLDVVTAAPARYGCDLGRLDRRTAAAWIAELTQRALMEPVGAALG